MTAKKKAKPKAKPKAKKPVKYPQHFRCLEVLGRDDLSVEWEYIGEGWSGDYQDDDPEDRPLLRANLSYKGQVLDDGSYCTAATTITPRKELRQAAKELMAHVKVSDSYRDTYCFNRRVMEQWTWRQYSK